MKHQQYGQSFTAEQVLEATQAEATDADGTEVMGALFNGVARRLKFDNGDRDNYFTARGGSAHDRLQNQVRRALDKLADEGVLVKAGRNETGPDGRNDRNVRYWTPARYKAAARARRDLEARKLAAREGWEAVNAALAEHGYFGTNQRHEPVRLSLATWQSLLGELAE